MQFEELVQRKLGVFPGVYGKARSGQSCETGVLPTMIAQAPPATLHCRKGKPAGPDPLMPVNNGEKQSLGGETVPHTIFLIS